jgi:large subunit ribosomal protein L31
MALTESRRLEPRTPLRLTQGDLMTNHPDLHLVDVHCSSCGTSFTTRSTAESIAIDVCSACHPAYTGRERATISGGRIERFNQRRALAA